MSRILISLIIALHSLNLISQTTDSKMYVLGHSLLDYRPDTSYSDEYTVPHWLHMLAQADGNTYAGGGKYGFLPQHYIFNDWFAQWGYDVVPPSWDSENESFEEADLTTLVFTAANFIQNSQAPDEDYFGQPGISPLSCAKAIVDSSIIAEPSIKVYIYENWPEMNNFTGNNFPPTEAQFQAYNNYTQTTFHDWWITYQDSLLLSNPLDSVKMIPVGPILGRLFADTILQNVPYDSLYVDGDPHGTPSLYLLAAMTTYMAVYQDQCPTSISLPFTIHSDIRNNYTLINDYIWGELQNYTDGNGISRVFFGGQGNTPTISVAAKLENGAFYIDDDNGLILKGRDGNCYLIYVNLNGQLVHETTPCP